MSLLTIKRYMPRGLAALIYLVTLGGTVLGGVGQTFAQQENFDSVTVPELPTDWQTGSTSNEPNRWVTTNNFSQTSPNSVFFRGNSTAARTTIDSPAYFTPKVFTSVTFHHKYQFEASPTRNFDGGRLYVSNGLGSYGENLELTTLGGSFLIGGYTGNIATTTGSFIPGASAWVGDSNGFRISTFSLPLGLTDPFQSLSWGFHSDQSVISTGWWIDSVSFSPSVDLQVFQTISPNPAIFGATATYEISVSNLSNTPASNVELNGIIPKAFQPSAINSSSGSVTLGHNTVVARFPILSPGATATVSLVGRVRSETLVENSLRVIEGQKVLKRAYGMRHMDFSPSFPEGVNALGLVSTFDFVAPVNDACETQVLGGAGVGRVGVAIAGGCSLTQKAINMQNAGMVAAIIVSANDDIVEANEAGWESLFQSLSLVKLMHPL